MTNNKRFYCLGIAALVALLAPPVAGQEVQTFTVPLSEPGSPVTLEASLLYGGIAVEGHDASDVVIEVVPEVNKHKSERARGMQVIPNNSLGLSVEEHANHIEVHGNWASKIEQLRIKAPRRTSLMLNCTNGGDIHVRGVAGEHELQNTNGEIEALEIDGSVVAHTTNGDVKVTFLGMETGKAMSFVTFNGDVDVTFLPGLRSNLRLSAGQGEIYTDFEFDVLPQSPVASQKREGGVFKLELEREVHAAIGGGGPDMHFKTWNGDIYIRKSGS